MYKNLDAWGIPNVNIILTWQKHQTKNSRFSFFTLHTTSVNNRFSEFIHSIPYTSAAQLLKDVTKVY